MDQIDTSDIFKFTDNRRARSKRRLHDPNVNINKDLADQLNSLQKAFANERGISEQYRQETLAMLRTLLQRRGGYPG